MEKVSRLALTLVIALFFSPIMAQTPTMPLVEEGKSWHLATLQSAVSPSSYEGDNLYKDLHGQWYVGYPYEMTLQGDTVLNGKTYKSLIRTDKAAFICGLRQEGDRIYACYSEGMQEELQFDFSLKVGDVFCNPTDEMEKMVVGKVDTISINGHQCKRFMMYIINNLETVVLAENLVDVWVEGIGCMNGPRFPFWWGMIGNRPLLLDCRQGERVLATTETFTTGVVDAITHLPLRSLNNHGTTYDLQGRRLKEAPQKGLYIKDGKKKSINIKN